ncbi:MAG: hypothetical protein RLZZ210_249 [Pseudomonadota bacterium]|jgi:alkyl hydroperoxide reductase subunit D
MDFINNIKSAIPDYAKDIRLNLDSVIARSPLEQNVALGCTVAAAFASKSKLLLNAIKTSGALDATYLQAALTAASLMAMNNTWYPYVEMTNDSELKSIAAGLRMNAYATHGGIDKNHFEMFTLAASIVGKCHFCVESHYKMLKSAGISVGELKEVGKIAATVVAVANILEAESV